MMSNFSSLTTQTVWCQAHMSLSLGNWTRAVALLSHLGDRGNHRTAFPLLSKFEERNPALNPGLFRGPIDAAIYQANDVAEKNRG